MKAKVRFAYPSSNQNSDAASASGWLRSSGSTAFAWHRNISRKSATPGVRNPSGSAETDRGLPSGLQLAVTSVICSRVPRGSCFQVRKSIGTQNQEVLVPVLAGPSGQPGARGGGMEDGRSMLSLGSRHPHGQAAASPLPVFLRSLLHRAQGRPCSAPMRGHQGGAAS